MAKAATASTSAKASKRAKASKPVEAPKVAKAPAKRAAAKSAASGTAKDFPLPAWLKNAKPGGIRGRKPVRADTRTPGAYKGGANGVHVFRLLDLEPLMAGYSKKTGNLYADTQAVVVEGQKLQVGLAYERAGMGSRPHHHPNDQFNFVLKGTLRCKIGDEPEMLVPAGSVVYFPANVVHSSGATADGDVIFYVVKDLSWELIGIPVDETIKGPRSGFAAVKARAKAGAKQKASAR